MTIRFYSRASGMTLRARRHALSGLVQVERTAWLKWAGRNAHVAAQVLYRTVDLGGFTCTPADAVAAAEGFAIKLSLQQARDALRKLRRLGLLVSVFNQKIQTSRGIREVARRKLNVEFLADAIWLPPELAAAMVAAAKPGGRRPGAGRPKKNQVSPLLKPSQGGVPKESSSPTIEAVTDVTDLSPLGNQVPPLLAAPNGAQKESSSPTTAFSGFSKRGEAPGCGGGFLPPHPKDQDQGGLGGSGGAASSVLANPGKNPPGLAAATPLSFQLPLKPHPASQAEAWLFPGSPKQALPCIPGQVSVLAASSPQPTPPQASPSIFAPEAKFDGLEGIPGEGLPAVSVIPLEAPPLAPPLAPESPGPQASEDPPKKAPLYDPEDFQWQPGDPVVDDSLREMLALLRGDGRENPPDPLRRRPPEVMAALPPYPGSDVLEAPRTPRPLKFDGSRSLDERMDLLLRTWRGATKHFFGSAQDPSRARGFTGSALEAKLQAAVVHMTQRGMRAAPWIGFRFASWKRLQKASPKKSKRSGKALKMKAPPIAWVFGLKALDDLEDWFWEEAPHYSGNRVIMPTAKRELIGLWQEMMRHIRQCEPGTETEIVNRILPPDLYAWLLDRARRQAAHAQMILDEKLAAGAWLWD